MSLRDEKKAQTRGAILEAARKRFETEGFGAARIRDIAGDARVSEQTVFNYFPSKECLLSQMAVDWYSASAEWLHEQAARVEAAPDLPGFLESLRAALNWAQGDRAILRLLVPRAQLVHASAAAGGETSQERELVAVFEDTQVVLSRIFAAFQRSGAIRDDVDPGFITESYAALFQGALLNWAVRPVSSGEALGDRVVRALGVLLRGLAPDPASRRESAPRRGTLPASAPTSL